MTDQYTVTGRMYKPPDPGIRIPRSPRAVCGDDVAAAFYDGRFSRTFRQIVVDTRMMLSPGKDGDSQRVIMFCEEHVYARYDSDKQTWVFVYLDTIKCRLLTNMSRQGTSRVASILGKGLTISKQLDWFPSHTVRQVTVKVFMDLFNRLYDDWPKSIRLPLRLPAHCGGLALPLVGNYSDWELEHIKYVLWLCSKPRNAENLTEVIKLRNLAHRYRYGISAPDVSADLVVDLQGFTFFEGEIDTVVDTDRIYTVDQAKAIYSLITGRPPVNPYTQEGEPSHNQLCVMLRDEAGLVPVWDALDQVERAVTFSRLLQNAQEEPEVLSLNKWVKKASRYWSRIEKRYKSEYSDFPVPPDIRPSDVNWAIQDYWGGGFVFKKAFTTIALRYGPSLALDLNVRRKLPATPRPAQVKSTIDLLSLRLDRGGADYLALDEDVSSST